MTPEKWQADVDAFARELPKRHLNAFHAMTRAEFDQAVAALRAKAPTASDNAMIAGLLQITASIGDGHTRVLFPAGIHRLPVGFLLFGDDLRITSATEDAKSLLGGKLVRINDTPVAEVMARFRTVISQHESEAYVRGTLPAYVPIFELLHGLGITSDARKARLTVVSDDGKETSLEVVAVPADASRSGWPNAAKATQLSRQKPEEGFFVTQLAKEKAVYLNFRNYEDLGSRSRAFWKLVDGSGAEKVIIDLRQNGGGDYTKGRKYLVQELAARPKLKGYVLVGNRTFSAAMNNAIHFRDEARATLVGQPIGERPNSYQENDQIALPNSKLVVAYSTRFYKFLPDGAPPIVTPHKTFEPEWAEYVAGRDAALEWALAQ